MRARSEDILINPADNRFHGDYFVLQAEEAPRRPGELEETIRSLGAKLSWARLPGGDLSLKLATRDAVARFTISLNSRPPVFACETLSGSFAPDLLPRVGRLLLASAAAAKRGRPARAKRLPDIKKNIPKILKIAESWR